MSLLTRAAILDKYGLRLTMEQLADALAIHPSTVYTMVARGDCPVRTYKERNRRFASYDAVADYLDGMAETAKARSDGDSDA